MSTTVNDTEIDPNDVADLLEGGAAYMQAHGHRRGMLVGPLRGDVCLVGSLYGAMGAITQNTEGLNHVAHSVAAGFERLRLLRAVDAVADVLGVPRMSVPYWSDRAEGRDEVIQVMREAAAKVRPDESGATLP